MIGIKDLAQLNIARRRKRPTPPPRPGTLSDGLQREQVEVISEAAKHKPPPAFPPPPRKPPSAISLPPPRVANPLRASKKDASGVTTGRGPRPNFPNGTNQVSSSTPVSMSLASSSSSSSASSSSLGGLKPAPPGYWKPPPPSAASLPAGARPVNRAGARGILTPLSASKQACDAHEVAQDESLVSSVAASGIGAEVDEPVVISANKEAQQENAMIPQRVVEDMQPEDHAVLQAAFPDCQPAVLGKEDTLSGDDDREEKEVNLEAGIEASNVVEAESVLGSVDDAASDAVTSSSRQKPRPKLTIRLFDDEDENENEDGDGGANGKDRYSQASGEGWNTEGANDRVGSQGPRIGGTSTKLSLQIESDDEDEFGNSLGPLHGESEDGSAEFIAIGNFEVREQGIRSNVSSDEGDGNVKNELVMMAALGQGAGGIVYKAVHRPTLRLVAVKTIPVYDPTKRSQMLKELKALYENMAPIGYRDNAPLLDTSTPAPCPFIVTFHDAFINPEMANVAMVVEYMDGGSLQDIIDGGGCENEDILSQIAYRVLRGLQFIHERHQIHRDIKPSNLLINHRGEVKISDFGIVRELESTQAMASTFVGTLTYMSPERISGLAYNANSDVWSFGLSLMSVALGTYPLATAGGYWALLSSLNEGPVPRLPEDRFSPIMIDFVAQCLTRDPHQRPSCEQLLQHPFVTQSQPLVDAQMIAGENVPPTNADSNLAELNDLVEALGRAEEQRQLGPNPPLENVSRQLGVTLSLVEAKFASLLSVGNFGE